MPAFSFVARLIACAVLPALSACSTPTTAEFDAQMAGFIGQPETKVITTFGVPVRTYEAGGLHFLQYESRRIVSYPSAYPYFGYSYGGWRRFGGYGGFGPFPYADVESRECDLTFTLRGDQVQGFTRRGNDCRAVPPAKG